MRLCNTISFLVLVLHKNGIAIVMYVVKTSMAIDTYVMAQTKPIDRVAVLCAATLSMGFMS
jgi:hypothetical protein